MVRVHEKHLKDNAVIGHSLRRFMRGRSYLTNLIFFYDQGDKEKPVGVIFLDFSKFQFQLDFSNCFSTVSFCTKCPAYSLTKTM